MIKESRKQPTPPVSLFYYWSDGNSWHELVADPPTPEEAKPFHVLFRSETVIPVSVLVFARDEAHALHRVRASIQEVIAKDYRREPDKYGQDMNRASHYGKKLLDGLESGEYAAFVAPYDVTRIAAQVNWACNGGIL